MVRWINTNHEMTSKQFKYDDETKIVQGTLLAIFTFYTEVKHASVYACLLAELD